jgi:uncharacterized protein (TIGR03435 family)
MDPSSNGGFVTRFVLLLIAGAAWALSQTADPASPKFEVASVKPSGPQSVRGREGGPGSRDPTHYSFRSATLQDLIAEAWNVRYFQILSKSAVDKDRFDVVVNVPEGSTRDQFCMMMRNLLAERFQLKTHIASKDFPAYELVIAKSGLKMKESGGASESTKPAAVRDGFPTLPPGPGLVVNFSSSGAYRLVRTRGRQQPLSALARTLRTPGEEPVVDKTGLTGKYDFTLEYTIDSEGAGHGGDAEPSVAPTIFTALQEQLGLQLVARKSPFDVVVVESFERTPVGN